MDRLGGFDPNVGITWRLDGESEIGHANLPPSMKLLPGEFAESVEALAHGRVSDSSLMDRFNAYFDGEPRFRELLSPDAFFEVLENAGQDFANEAAAGDKPFFQAAAERINAVLGDRELCEALRKLVLEA